MRNIYFLCCVALASLCACESETKEEPVSDFSDLVIQIVLTDPELNDRLNPGSPSFLGEEYTQGIEVLYRYKDQKLTLPQLWPLQTNGGAILGEWSTIYPPYMEDNGYGKTDGNTKGYYYIEASPFVTEGNRDIAYTYIQYPDGNEDEIKVQLYRTSSLLLMDQIWINGELVYCRVGQGHYCPFPPSEPYLKVSNHTAQAVLNFYLLETSSLLHFLS